ncbi:MAG: hypothetical protein J6X31_02255 [Bacteroidales bacterium]|nr:hypothetical protein [Bacteroidales bacterium]
MKKLFFSFVVSALAWSASAQSLFVTGTGSFENNTTYDAKSTNFMLEIGREFNDVFAVSIGGGMESVHYDGMDAINIGLAGANLRVTPWNNEKFFVDLNWENVWAFHEDDNNWATAISPGLRYRINDHFDISTNVATFGWIRNGEDSECVSRINFIPTTFTLSYRF